MSTTVSLASVASGTMLLWAGAGEELAGDLGPDPRKLEPDRRHLADQLIQLLIGVGDLFGQLLVAAGEAAKGGLGACSGSPS